MAKNKNKNPEGAPAEEAGTPPTEAPAPAPENTPAPPAEKEPTKSGKGFEVRTGGDSSYKSTVELNGKIRHFECVKGVIKTNDAELAEFLDKKVFNAPARAFGK